MPESTQAPPVVVRLYEAPHATIMGISPNPEPDTLERLLRVMTDSKIAHAAAQQESPKHAPADSVSAVHIEIKPPLPKDDPDILLRIGELCTFYLSPNGRLFDNRDHPPAPGAKPFSVWAD